MFGIDSAEFLIIALVALMVIGPNDLPKVMRTIGQWAGRARGMAKHFRAGVDTMMREAELEEMEKGWKADNDRIMREHPSTAESEWAEPQPALEAEAPAETTPIAAPAAAAPLAVPPNASKPKPPPRKREAPPLPAGPPAPSADDAT